MPCLSGYGIWRIIFFPVAIANSRWEGTPSFVFDPVASDLAASVS
jgi:hypothetical protein